MGRAILSLILVAAFSAGGVVRAFSETALELVDRAQKDLQARYGAEKEKPGATDQTRSGTEEYAYQNAAGGLQQVRQFLEAGNENAALQQLVQLRAGNGVPRELRAAVEGIFQQARTERAAKDAALTAEVEAVRQRAGSILLKAKEPKDLDATLLDLARLANSFRSRSRYADSDSSEAGSRLQSDANFVKGWQDYLLARSRNNESGVASALRNLADNNVTLLVPRSEILARQPETAADSDAANRPRRPARPRAQIDAEAVEIVRSVKQLDDLPAALDKLVALRKEVTAQPSYNLNSESDFGVAQTSLQSLQRTYAEIQNGLATSVSLGYSRADFSPRPDLDNALLPLRVQLIRLAAPRLLGIPEDEPPVANEALDACLRRLIESAKKRQDWAAVARGLELKHTLATLASTPYTVTNDQEVAAFRNFFAGRNLEEAGQFEQAVISYLTALRSGQEDLPSSLIGEHLAAIQKAHPAEHAAGSKYALNPPPSPYPNYPPYGPPGMMGRGGYDPRFPGHPGFPGTPPPPEEKLAVPAAAPVKPAPESMPVPTPTPAPTVAPKTAP